MPEELQVVARGTKRSPTRRDIAAVFFRNKQLLLSSFAAVFLLGIGYSAVFPSYRAEMKILVRRGRMDPAVAPVATVPPVVDRDEISEEEMNSETDLVQDQDVLRNVVVETGLAEKASWLSRLRRESGEERIEHAVQELAEKIEVQPVRKSRLITVSYKSSDPQRSAAVLRSLANAFEAKQNEIRRPSGQQAFFEVQMNQARKVLEDTQTQLLDFTQRNGVTAASVQRDLTLQKLSDAESADLALQASVVAEIGKAASLELTLRNLPERRVSQIRNADNPQLQEKLKSRLLELQLRRTELLTKFQPSYRLVQEIDTQIAQARAAIEAEETKPLRDELTEQDPDYEWAHSEQVKNQVELKTLEKRLTAVHSQVMEYHKAAQRFGENAITQDLLEQKLKSAREKYLLYANKREEARIGDALDQEKILNVAIAEQPHVPALPVWPLWAATCMSFAGALVFGTGTAFAADFLNPSFRTPDELRHILGTPVLGYLQANSRSDGK